MPFLKFNCLTGLGNFSRQILDLDRFRNRIRYHRHQRSFLEAILIPQSRQHHPAHNLICQILYHSHHHPFSIFIKSHFASAA